MPKLREELPIGVRPYIFHGLDIQRESSGQWRGECFLCYHSDEKWFVNESNFTWNCFNCADKGNQYEFIQKLYALGDSDDESLSDLADDRGLSIDTLKSWGVIKSPIRNEYLIPGYSISEPEKMTQLYRYSGVGDGKGRRLLPCPEVGGHKILGIHLYDPKKKDVYLCEGPWDGMRLWETLGSHREYDGRITKAKGKSNFLKKANVLAVPGCSTFKENWSDVFRGKNVYIVFDSDHPRPNPKTNRMRPPAGLTGVQRVTRNIYNKSSEVKYLRWGEDGYDKNLPSGYDLRDFFNPNNGSTTEVKIGKFFDLIRDVPDEWKISEIDKKQQALKILPKDCDNWKTLTDAWQDAMRWIDGMDIALSVMLATVASTMLPGKDQLWVKIVAPPSSGKTTLCEALAINKRYVKAQSTFTGFYSGFKTDDKGKEDNSLLATLFDMTLVTKDADALLQMMNLSKILSEARDIFDGVSRPFFKNKMSKDYENVRLTWILCGTSSIRSIDQSELGERFLDCVIMEGIDDDLENEILDRVYTRELRNLKMSEVEAAKNTQDPKQKLAMQLTGGYVGYLRENVHRLLSGISISQEVGTEIKKLGKFISFARARPSDKQIETAEKEMAGRLVSQLLRLAGCLTVVLNRQHVDEEVIRRVKKVALDTSRGVTMEIFKKLYQFRKPNRLGLIGLETQSIAAYTDQEEKYIKGLLKFLREIGAIYLYTPKRKEGGPRHRPRWRLKNTFLELYEHVMGS